MFLEPAIGGVSHNRQYPGSRITPPKLFEPFQGPDIGVLNNILRVMVLFDQHPRETVGSVQLRQKQLFKT